MMPSPPDQRADASLKVVAGLGCRRHCPQEELFALLIHSLAPHGLAVDNLVGLASVVHKRDEPGLLALAERLGLTLTLFTPEELAPYQAMEPGNALALASAGTPAVAEPSALALAARLGAAPRLLGGKTRSASATCGLAPIDTEPAA